MDAHVAVVQQAMYDVYGATTSASGTQTATRGYAGQQQDPSGLLYMKDRYYDPATGRFLSRDSYTLKDPLTYPVYVYAGDNPVNANDPSGHCDPEDPLDCAVPPVSDEPDGVDAMKVVYYGQQLLEITDIDGAGFTGAI